MMFYIETLDGIRFDLKQYGLRGLKLEMDSLSPRHDTTTVDSMDGHIDIETTYEGRTMRASFLMEAKNRVDYHFSRSKIFRLFNAKTKFYIIDKFEPKKRWKVRTATRFTPERINHNVGLFTLDLISSSPYAESMGTTLNPSYTDGYLQVSSNEPVQYTFNQSTFKVWNEGDVKIDPCRFPLKITFDGASNNLYIRNITTGDVWLYNGSTVEGDVITLDGIRSLKNGFSIFKDTNKKLIKLVEKGWNEFEIFGATSPFTISFDFRFYYI
ncbi:phage tail family protein [Bacillus sp. FJAT-49705]|uniref:Phage tail family protein n=1 Tax=Cytobacillus citreus TaxID=2833586 RepID=A0ABS5NTM1_9BACI|nr:phage tail family protein [Cytobacillus citreus]MBS4191187.1 phage tail family protein [Cytobacillus citreus]